MFCPKCGKELPDGSRFCTYCGAPVEEIIRRLQRQTIDSGTNTSHTGNVVGNNPSFKISNDPAARWQPGVIIGMVGGLLIFFAVFLPAYRVTLLGSVSYTYLRGYEAVDSEDALIVVGIIQLALGAIVTLLACFKKKIATIVLASVSILWTIIWLAAIVSTANDNRAVGLNMTCGAGPVLALIGAIVALVGGIMIKRLPKKSKKHFKKG